MTDPIDFKHEAAKRDADVKISVEDALRIALKEYENRADKDGLFQGDEITEVYIAFRTKGGGTENFPSIVSSGERLNYMGLLAQHLHNEAEM